MTTDKILMSITITETISGDQIFYRAHVIDNRTRMQVSYIRPAAPDIVRSIQSIIEKINGDKH